ncbi:sarcosine oxidase subunit alpha family protein [Streptomyces sioyaensis]|uniref:Sarcosine oxidase subunit alpha n=1 Tax=Streptomyces sioyaensis TaxID=67364 RepID=A0A4Q1RBQ7_9ACTN|nr:sarcosine oxidase subunit alpha family protein [Streptomyces sioyaensis]MBM4793732.1 sarcosine oxidase subunit alpha family protein [Streptomyces sioyaensis]RXS70934.1 sarcosine oxidase subunit alpha family protein [Streptomyces sioyaensis]
MTETPANPHRLARGGRIDRSASLSFTFDGTRYHGHRGDTLASALLASGVRTVAPSIYRRRARGIVAAGVEEPNALVQLDGPCQEPMLPATTVELFDGLSARSLSGKGRLDPREDTALYDKKYVHCDVLVIGGGPAGLAAALAAGRSGARVILVDEQNELGGSLLSSRAERIDHAPASDWVASARDELTALPEVRLLTRATAVGVHDHGLVLVAERRTDHLGSTPLPGVSRQRLWHVRARQTVLATGAHERPLVFADNDRPGVMLAHAVRTYVNRYAVLPGRRAVVVTTNDSAYATAIDLVAAGVQVPVLVDARPEPPPALVAQVRAAGVEVRTGSAVVGTDGDPSLTAAWIAPLDRRGGAADATAVPCDLLAVSGGWNPVLHLFGQAQGTLRYDESLAAFVPERRPKGLVTAGAANGTCHLAGCLDEGTAAGTEAAARAGFTDDAPPARPRAQDAPPAPARALWTIPGGAGEPPTWHTHFVDLQRDATVADIHRAIGAGMRSVEHIKRYTTIGTGQDQGKTGAVVAIGAIAEALGVGSPGEVGTTTFRPPYTPVSFALLAGRDRGHLNDPVRVTPIHDWHVAHGAAFEDVGQWKRPWYYPRPDETMEAAVLRECRAAREAVAVMDASTLGKIDIQGPDAGEFLNRLYTNAFAKLKVGSCRYGVLCKADGMVFDDGVVMRLAPDRYLATTTTSGAAAVLEWMEMWLQTEWPDLRVHCTSVTEQWATVAVVGPKSRAVLAHLAPDLDLSAEAFAFMDFRETRLADGVPARIARVSFSGELAFEINVASWHGRAVWDAVMAAGAAYDITPYGTETMHVLRAEKGFIIVGQDTDGTVTPEDLGMGWVVSKRKEFVGKRSYRRPDTARPDRKHLVGLLPDDPTELLPEGAQLVADGVPTTTESGPVPMLGHVTSSYRSAVLGHTFALALVKDGRNRLGQSLQVPLVGRTVRATVTEPVFYDKEGTRRDG